MRERRLSSILVTGGAGFIGSNFIRYMFNRDSVDGESFTGKIVNVDALTYAGNPENLVDIAQQFPERYQFLHGDINDVTLLNEVFEAYEIDAVVNFAAESHVDRSIKGPEAFIQTNINGTFRLLDAAKKAWHGRDGVLFHQVSTDEVFGSLGAEGYFTENTPYDPRSPYAASKASADHLVRAYHHTYGLPVTATNCSNNYGPYQFPEKLIPLMILNMTERKPLPIYGDGKNIRDWLYVDDHSEAIWRVLRNGRDGTSYNVGGENEWDNLSLVETLCEVFAEETKTPPRVLGDLITHIPDRPGHDRRYAIDCRRIQEELGWAPQLPFRRGLKQTVRWYLDNTEWVRRITSGEYRAWIEENYEGR